MKVSFASLTRFQLKGAANCQSRQLFVIHINPHPHIMINHSPLLRLQTPLNSCTPLKNQALLNNTFCKYPHEMSVHWVDLFVTYIMPD